MSPLLGPYNIDLRGIFDRRFCGDVYCLFQSLRSTTDINALKFRLRTQVPVPTGENGKEGMEASCSTEVDPGKQLYLINPNGNPKLLTL